MRLYLLHLGTVLDNGAPVPGYLIRADDGTDVLVDAGYRPGTFGEDARPERAAFEVREEDLVVNRLAWASPPRRSAREDGPL